MLEHYFLIIIVCTLFAVLWLLFVTVHRNYHTALTRQRLFTIRAKLFNYALAGSFSFDDPAYRLVRETINGMIRFTHTLSIPRWIALVLLNRFGHKQLLDHFNDSLNKAFNAINKEQKKLLLDTLDEAHWQIVRHLMSVSVLWAIFKPISLVLKLIDLTRTMREWANEGNRFSEEWRRFDAEALYNSGCGDKYELDDCLKMAA